MLTINFSLKGKKKEQDVNDCLLGHFIFPKPHFIEIYLNFSLYTSYYIDSFCTKYYGAPHVLVVALAATALNNMERFIL